MFLYRLYTAILTAHALSGTSLRLQRNDSMFRFRVLRSARMAGTHYEDFRVLTLKFSTEQKHGHQLFFKPHNVRAEEPLKPRDRTLFLANMTVIVMLLTVMPRMAQTTKNVPPTRALVSSIKIVILVETSLLLDIFT